MIEHRKSKRFPVKLPAKVVRSGSRPIDKEVETENLSSCGILFRPAVDVHVGDAVEYYIDLPPQTEKDPGVRIRCLGTVIRCDTETAAATIERYEFLRPSKG